MMELDPPSLQWGIIQSLRWVVLRGKKRSDAMGQMVVVVVVVVVVVDVLVLVAVELIVLNKYYCLEP